MVDIADWASTETKKILITQDIDCTPPCYLKVRRFVPAEGDAMARKWKNHGVEQEFLCTPYAIADMKEAARTLSSYVDETMEQAIQYYTFGKDKLLRDTYQMAYSHSKSAEVSKTR